MAREIAEIRRDIEGTRERLRDTAEAIGWKADVPARARDLLRETAGVVRERVASGEHSQPRRGGDGGPSLTQRVGAIASTVTGSVGSAASSVTGGVGSAASGVSDTVGGSATSAAASAGGLRDTVAERLPDREAAARGVRRAAGTARANPLAIAAGALAVGALAGLLLPSTRVEDERLGEVADEVREKGADLAQEAIDRGRGAVQTVTPDDAGEGAS